ncbi:MAG: histidine kinase [Bacteroidales bacterium]|nr:histidine kinase [Bacteroidales bacterium]MDD3665069.1 histidine kinase [Bacteroidales bacterium]
MSRRKISLTEKMVVYTLLLATPAMVLFGSYVWMSGRRAIMDRTFQQLISVRVEKQQLLEQYFQNRVEAARLYLLDTVQYKLPPDLYGLVKVRPTACIPKSVITVRLSEKPVAQVDRRAPVYLLVDCGGSVCCQFSVDEVMLNQIMINKNPYNGLGITGEAYLTGSDTLMRTTSRFHKNAILNTRVVTRGIQRALNGETGTGVYTDYRGIEVFGAYAPFKMQGLTWVVAAEIDTSEALLPVTQLGRNILFMGIFTTLAIFTAVWLAARKITRPLVRLRDAAEKISSGDYDQRVSNTATDETGELTDSFNFMAAKLSLQAEQLKKEQLSRARAMIDGQELERQRLSREIHDSLGQNLLAVKMLLNRALSTPGEPLLDLVKPAAELTSEAIHETRAIINDLRPPSLTELGLAEALKNLCREMEQATNIAVKCECQPVKCSPVQAVYFYRIAQEALQNVVKHARADQVVITLQSTSDKIVLKIVDNGKGINLPPNELKVGGLRNIRDRVQILGGCFHMDKGPQGGTVVQIEVDLTS